MHPVKLPIENILNNSIIAWIPKKRDTSVLCVNVNSAANVMFEMCGMYVDYSSEDALDEILCSKKKYDYIFAFEVLEKSSDPVELLKKLKMLLNAEGVLYLGTDNRLGLRYFCGDIDISTGKSLSGIQQYNDINTGFLKYRLYAKYEIEHFLLQAGMENPKFYSVLPNLEAAQLIYSHDYLPEERLATRYIPMYHDPSRIFIREEWIYDSLIKNKMFHQMANSYLIEYHTDGEGYNDILHVTLSADRGEEYSCATMIHTHTVEKRALYPEGVQRLLKIKSYDDDLTEHGVPMIESTIGNDIYIMPRIDAETLERCMQAALAEDVEKFLLLFDKYKDIVYRSSDIVKVDEHGPIMKRCYIDLVPLNCFYKNEKFLFYDQEFYLENEPANLILWRATVIVYDGNPTLSAILPIEKLWDRYGITAHAEEYGRKSSEFLRSIRNQEQLAEFNRKHVRDIGRVMENQRKMEHIMIDWQEQKEKYKETCFDDLEGKEIYIWGSGRYADEFICMYRYDYSITGVLDNNIEKHGTEFYGYSIKSPEILRGKNPETYKVIACVKNCNEILEQLYDMGVRYIGVFDIAYVYPGRQKYLPGHEGLAKNQEFYIAPSVDGVSEKKYHIGYIAGVFDLFHLGHLNMFRRAKEMCDYLIVGVVSDEGVRINKKMEPFIPFDERIEMVRSCRYVDEAVEIPFVYCRTPEAFRKYHFDVQFSGSDYENDPGWLDMKKYLEDHGSTMVFFSYTQQTSSTKIKALIDRNLESKVSVSEAEESVT